VTKIDKELKLLFATTNTMQKVQTPTHSPQLGDRFEHLRVSSPYSSPSGSPKARKPYTATKQRENWSPEEHQRFVEAVRLYRRDWKQIEKYVGSKNVIQIRSHAQKYFMKLQKANSGDKVPPPRPKRPSPKAVASSSSANSSPKINVKEEKQSSPALPYANSAPLAIPSHHTQQPSPSTGQSPVQPQPTWPAKEPPKQEELDSQVLLNLPSNWSLEGLSQNPVSNNPAAFSQWMALSSVFPNQGSMSNPEMQKQFSDQLQKAQSYLQQAMSYGDQQQQQTKLESWINNDSDSLVDSPSQEFMPLSLEESKVYPHVIDLSNGAHDQPLDNSTLDSFYHMVTNQADYAKSQLSNLDLSDDASNFNFNDENGNDFFSQLAEF